MSSVPQYILHSRISGSGPTLVLLHGVSGSGAIWQAMLPQLEKHFTVIRLDLLGYGYSPKPKVMYTPRLHLQTIHNTLKNLNIKKPYNIVGLSMGAILTLLYTQEYSSEVNKVVCLATPYFESKRQAESVMKTTFWANITLHHRYLSHVQSLAWFIGARSRFLSNLLAPKMYRGVIAQESMLTTVSIFRSNLLHCMIHFRLHASDLTKSIPTLFLHGENDKWVSVAQIKQFAQKLPNASVVAVPQSGHNIALLQPAKTTHCIINFYK